MSRVDELWTDEALLYQKLIPHSVTWANFTKGGLVSLNQGEKQALATAYHCPPVPPPRPWMYPVQCFECPIWLDEWWIACGTKEQKGFPVDIEIMCRDVFTIHGLSTIDECTPCHTRYRYMMDTHAPNTPFTGIELWLIDQFTLKLPHGGEMIL